MKGKYIKHRPQSTKAKGGNPSYFKQQNMLSSPCTNMNGEIIESGGKYFAKDGEVRKKRVNNGTHYVYRKAHQVIKRMNEAVVYGTVSLLETGQGKQFWVARESVTEWDSEQCCEVEVLIGESMSVIEMSIAKGCWVEVEKEDIVDTQKPTKNSAINRMAGVFK
jgi:hypothetical protein